MSYEILQGDCIERMAEMEEASVDAVVCDPPYGIGFMGHEWDQPGEFGAVKKNGRPAPFASGRKDPARGHGQTGANGSIEAGRYDLSLTANRRYQGWCEAWAREAFRILKPGGHLLACGGSRTHHRLVGGVEDAGFEIRDRIDSPGGTTVHITDGTLAWYFGTGFPKGKDVHKALVAMGEKQSRSWLACPYGSPAAEACRDQIEAAVVELEQPVEDAEWDGWNIALKPSHEPIVVARKPLIGTVAENVLEHGTGGINVGACRIDGKPRSTHADGSRHTGAMGYHGGRPVEQVVPEGRWPANVVLSHLGECEAVGVRVLKGDQRETGNGRRTGGFADVGAEPGDGEPNAPVYGGETVTEWRCQPGCPVAELDAQSGVLQSGSRAEGVRGGMGYHGAKGDGGPAIAGGSGGASRFFYVAKTSRAERNAGLEGFEERPGGMRNNVGRPLAGHGVDPQTRNVHPTVKPLGLMRWLVRLVTPPGGTCLDPFLGSGSTGCAAVLEGFDFIGIEREAEYIAIAEARIAFWAQHKGREVEDVLGLHSASQKAAKAHADRGQISLEEAIEAAA